MSFSQSEPRATKAMSSTPPRIKLVPWDADSEEHIQRMFQQRKTCGWKQDAVRSWVPLQKRGDMALHWIVLDDAEKVAHHLATYVEERHPLKDSAKTLGGEPRAPTGSPFSPVGHISLDSVHDSPELGNRAEGLYSINTFYVSRALQSAGIGRVAMDEVESMAAREPLNAKTLALETIANEFEGREAKLKAQGRKKPEMSLQDWYGRRGYVVFKVIENAWQEEDLEGKMWPSTAVFMRKELGIGNDIKEI